MMDQQPNPIDELSLALAQAPVPLPASAKSPRSAKPLAAGVCSALLHALLGFGAYAWTFEVATTQDAKLLFAKGEGVDSVEARVTLIFPGPKKPGPNSAKRGEIPNPMTPAVAVSALEEKPASPTSAFFEKVTPPVRAQQEVAKSEPLPQAPSVVEEVPTQDPVATPPQPVQVPQVVIGPGPAPIQPVAPSPVKLERVIPEAAATNRTEAISPVSTSTVTGLATGPAIVAALPPIEFSPPMLSSFDVRGSVSTAGEERGETGSSQGAGGREDSGSSPASVPAGPSGPVNSRGSRAGVSNGVVMDLVKPTYPRHSVRAGEEGIVVLEIEVLADGTVGTVRVVQSPGFERLEKAAIDAVRLSRFIPAQVDGRAVSQVVRKSIAFRLTDVR